MLLTKLAFVIGYFKRAFSGFNQKRRREWFLLLIGRKAGKIQTQEPTDGFNILFGQAGFSRRHVQ
jgi:hypothetical protein